MRNLNEFILDVDLNKACSPVLMEHMERSVPAIPNGTGGYFVLLDKDPLDQPRVKNYRSISAEECVEARARFLAFQASETSKAA
ncbi:hypothetical protein [Adhaeribacter aquaticus]|uniref:hypothetical protein n=1 Tax=Adhaeribacter aquaticus TaxID=299567 RepID=UPI000420B5FF|nr:hypothetical protein [Adhaeribacter aquaticus]